MIPDPRTAAASNQEPRNSASTARFECNDTAFMERAVV
jgi:hypothetical protein